MTKSEFQELLRNWCLADAQGQGQLLKLKADVEFLGERLFDEYRPTKNAPEGPFSVRLAKWIGSAQDEIDQIRLFRLLKYLFFIGQDDLEAASKTAFSRHVLEWLISRIGINVLAADARQQIVQAQSLVRYTAITDSFNLGDFLRINDVQGHHIRYTWEQEKDNWDPAEFRRRVMQHGVQGETEKRYLVLLEDFVGSGSQAQRAVRNAQAIRDGQNSAYEVLFCPLIICPEGAAWAKQLQTNFANFHYSPVLELHESAFIKPTAVQGENADYPDLRDCVTRLHPTVVGPQPVKQDYGPFGYSDTGAVLVKYDNCPDNSLPVLHRKRTNYWEPLFKRASRLPING